MIDVATNLCECIKAYHTPTLEIFEIPQCVLTASGEELPTGTPSDGFFDDGYDF